MSYTLIDDSDRALLQWVLDWARRQRALSPRQHVPEQECQTPDIHVIKTPVGGISNRSGLVPGSAQVDVYRLLSDSLDLVDKQVFVYNLGDAIPGEVWTLAKRDKYGNWFVEQPPASVPINPETGTGTGTGDSSDCRPICDINNDDAQHQYFISSDGSVSIDDIGFGVHDLTVAEAGTGTGTDCEGICEITSDDGSVTVTTVGRTRDLSSIAVRTINGDPAQNQFLTSPDGSIVIADLGGGVHTLQQKPCPSFTVYESYLKCEEGKLNQYNRAVTFTTVAGCLTQTVSGFFYVSTVACCEDTCVEYWWCLRSGDVSTCVLLTVAQKDAALAGGWIYVSGPHNSEVQCLIICPPDTGTGTIYPETGTGTTNPCVDLIDCPDMCPQGMSRTLVLHVDGPLSTVTACLTQLYARCQADFVGDFVLYFDEYLSRNGRCVWIGGRAYGCANAYTGELVPDRTRTTWGLIYDGTWNLVGYPFGSGNYGSSGPGIVAEVASARWSKTQLEWDCSGVNTFTALNQVTSGGCTGWTNITVTPVDTCPPETGTGTLSDEYWWCLTLPDEGTTTGTGTSVELAECLQMTFAAMTTLVSLGWTYHGGPYDTWIECTTNCVAYPCDLSANAEHGTVSFEGGNTWQAPSGVTTVLVKCTAKGGDSPNPGGISQNGAGGGSYSRGCAPVTPDEIYTVNDGALGAGSYNFAGDDGSLVLAAPGQSDGTGGQAADCIGDLVFSGGAGGDATTPDGGGGGGGGGASEFGDGQDGTDGDATIGGDGGLGSGGVAGAGGDGTNAADVSPIIGQNYGGGGGGPSSICSAGGAGGSGITVLEW